MRNEDRLREYIREDIVYQRYLLNEEEEFSDFEMFCIEHCKDIDEILNRFDNCIRFANNILKSKDEMDKETIAKSLKMLLRGENNEHKD